MRDRIDLHLEVPAQRPDRLQHAEPGQPSAVVREQVQAARARMLARQGRPNGLLEPRGLRAHLHADAEAVEELGLSARAHDRILKVARTIADLDGRDGVGIDDVSEAIGYRVLDRSS